MSMLAHCPNCSKNFRVPHGDKTWHCKVCDGELELEAAEDPGTADGACHSCGEPNPAFAAFCGGCGESLAPTKDAPEVEPAAPPNEGRAPRRRRKQVEDPELEERRANKAGLRRILRRVQRLKWMLLGNFILLLLVIALGLLGLFASGAKDLDTDTTYLAVTLGVMALLAAMNLAAIKLVDRQPLAITSAIAGTYTLLAFWNVIDSGTLSLWLLWAAMVWAMVPDAAAITKLAKEDPDGYLARKMRGEHLRHEGREGAGENRALMSQRKERTQERKRFLLIGTAVALVAGLGYAGYWVSQAPPSPGDRIEAFRSAWNRSDIDAVAELAGPQSSDKFARQMRILQKRYEWEGQLPPLDSGEWKQPGREATRANVDYAGPDGPLEVAFKLRGKVWLLSQIDAAGVKSWRP